MRITQIVKKVKKKYGVNVSAKETSQSVILEGETCDYKQLVNIGKEFVDRKSGKHVVNNIVFTCAPHETIYQPNLTDNALDGKKVDVLVIGGGVIGCAVLRELTRYNLSCLLVEKHSDVAHGASGANDGMVHAGIDLHSGYLKTYYGPKGNSMF
ncbi:MAG: FAD-dependent oxidoreductase, partial [Clostridia bacterium]